MSGTLHRRGWRILPSSGFFWCVVALFVLQATWIALTGRYPQAFDEQFHFGVIQLHARQWWPFFSHQPGGAIGLGAVVSDPSFLYHYLMSFLYRGIRLFTTDSTIQLIFLRLVNVALAVWGLVVFRKLVLQLKLSRAWANGLVLIMTALPVFPLLAGQLNYDNLLLPLTGLSMIWAVRLAQRYQEVRQLDWALMLRLVTVCLFTSAVKYTFLPIFLAYVVYFLPILYAQRGTLLAEWRTTWQRSAIGSRLLVAGLVIIGAGMVAGSSGMNILRYHTVTPKCAQVLSVSECSAYGPWYRDYRLAQQNPTPDVGQIMYYPVHWVQMMVHETYFTIYSTLDKVQVVHYYTGQPIRVLAVAGWLWLGICASILLWALPFLWRRRDSRLLLLVAAFYLGALFVVNLLDFVRTDAPVAIHGRYVFPVTIPLLACVAIGLGELVKRYRVFRTSVAKQLATAALLVTLLVATQGGGFITYEVRSSNAWFWPQSHLAQTANAHLRGFLRAVVITD
jgi:hypothetical protein